MPRVYTKEYEYSKKVFRKYYSGKFKYRNIVPYIIFQVLTTMAFIVPGVMFAVIYWGISNPITKYLFWKEELRYNKGLISKYQFIFSKENITIRRNQEEEITLDYSTFKKIKNDRKGLYLLSRNKDFFIPKTEIENLEELKELLEEVKNVKIKLPKLPKEKKQKLITHEIEENGTKVEE